MKLLLIAVALTFFVCCEAHKFDYIRKYLAEHDKSSKPIFKRNVQSCLQNSNTIGLGYNPLYGSPVCYTGSCHGDGFKHSVVTLDCINSVIGSCTSQSIPNFVELHCIPSIDLQTSTETISTLNQLSDSISNAMSFGSNLKYKTFSSAYSHSKETRFVIDQIMKQNSTVMFTRGQITFGKLRMFERLMKLSQSFQFVIEQMPCCNEDSLEIDEYIQEFLIDYFGLTFVTELLLGGVAQETLTIDNNDIHNIQSRGQDISHSASIGLFLTFDAKPKSSSFNLTEQDQFMKTVKTKRSTKLGGDPTASTMDDWMKSIVQNPIILSYAVKDITALVDRVHFPNDNRIDNKSKLIEMGIQRYLSKQKPTCINDCTDSIHGECDVSTTPPFLLGTCQCKPGWKGIDCSQQDISTTTLPTTTINIERCNRICKSRRSVPSARCPPCKTDVYYGRGYYCCGGNRGASCGGRFTDDGGTCACNGSNCIIYDGGCGYFGYVDFDDECRCFFC